MPEKRLPRTKSADVVRHSTATRPSYCSDCGSEARIELSQWETGAVNIGSKSDLLIRSLVLNLGVGTRHQAERVARDFEFIDEESAVLHHRLEVDWDALDYAYA